MAPVGALAQAGPPWPEAGGGWAEQHQGLRHTWCSWRHRAGAGAGSCRGAVAGEPVGSRCLSPMPTRVSTEGGRDRGRGRGRGRGAVAGEPVGSRRAVTDAHQCPLRGAGTEAGTGDGRVPEAGGGWQCLVLGPCPRAGGGGGGGAGGPASSGSDRPVLAPAHELCCALVHKGRSGGGGRKLFQNPRLRSAPAPHRAPPQPPRLPPRSPGSMAERAAPAPTATACGQAPPAAQVQGQHGPPPPFSTPPSPSRPRWPEAAQELRLPLSWGWFPLQGELGGGPTSLPPWASGL